MNLKSDDRQIARLIDTGTELDPNLVAAYIDGGLSPAERLALERRMAADPEARLLARALQERSSRAALWIPVAAVAAAVLVGVLVWSKRDPGASLSLNERLVAVVSSLRADTGEPFADFAMLSDDELTTTSSPKRGGGTWLHPRGVLLAAPQVLRWQTFDDSDRVRLTIRGPGVNWTEDVEGTQTEAPKLSPGRFVVTMQALDSLAGQKLRRSFVIADAAERNDLQQAMDVIRAKADDDLEDLVVAHFAFRQRLYDVALTSAKRAAESTGDVKVAADKLVQHIDAVQGR